MSNNGILRHKKILATLATIIALIAPLLFAWLFFDNVYVVGVLTALVLGSFLINYLDAQLKLPLIGKINARVLTILAAVLLTALFCIGYFIYSLIIGAFALETLSSYITMNYLIVIAVILISIAALFVLARVFPLRLKRIERYLYWGLLVLFSGLLVFCGFVSLLETKALELLFLLWAYFAGFGLILYAAFSNASTYYIRSCKVCGSTFRSRKELRIHMKTMHPKKQKRAKAAQKNKKAKKGAKKELMANSRMQKSQQSTMADSLAKAQGNGENQKKKLHVKKPRYERVGQISIGGMALVEKYRDNKKGKVCVIKKPIHNDNYKFNVDKLKSEAAILSKLKHPNIVGYIDSFNKNAEFHLVEEYVEGISLNTKYRGRGAGEKEIKGIAMQMLDALEYLHKNGIIHRDVNPNNVMIAGDKIVMIDFGTAKMNFGTTAVFTYGYAAPEQIANRHYADVRSDIYSVGATLYFLATGQDPQKLHMNDPLPVPRGLSKKMTDVITKATESEPNKRYQSAKAMKIAIEYGE